MKILILFIIFIFPTKVFSKEKVYYCIENEVIGFSSSKDWKIKEFRSNKFSMKVDFENKVIISDYLRFSDPKKFMSTTVCSIHPKVPNKISCISPRGYSLSFHRNTNEFILSFHTLMKDGFKTMNGDIIISYGKCESF